MWLKNYARHTLLKFEIVLAGNPFFSQARDTKFGGKLKTYEYINWWKFGVDILNHFRDIQNLRFFVFQVSPNM